MGKILLFISLISCLSAIGQGSIEYGSVLGLQKLYATGLDDYHADTDDNSFHVTPFAGLFASYNLPLDTDMIRFRVHASYGRIHYDIYHSSGSRGNGSSHSYYNQQDHKVMMFNFQMGLTFPIVKEEKTNFTLVLGPEYSHHLVLSSKGRYGSTSFAGFSPDSTGTWVGGPRTESNEEVTGRSQRSLSPGLFGLFLGLDAVHQLNSKSSFVAGVEGAIGLNKLVRKPGVGDGEASKMAVRITAGLRIQLGHQEEKQPKEPSPM